MEEELFQFFLKTKEAWQLNIMCKPGLDTGSGWAIAIKDFIGATDEI